MDEYSDLTKEDLIENLKIASENLKKFDATEKDRLRLLNENQSLKDKIDRQNVIEKYIQEEAKKLNRKFASQNKTEEVKE